MSESISDDVLPESPVALLKLMNAAAAKLNDVSFTSAAAGDLLVAAETNEQMRARVEAATTGLMIELSDRFAFQAQGYMTVQKYLTNGLRLGVREANARIALMFATGEFRSVVGDRLTARNPAAARALRDGVINRGHVAEISAVIDKIPARVDPDTVAAAEAQLAEVARTLSPEGVRTAGRRLLGHLDPDGELTDDADRRRTRGFTLGPQDARLMSTLRASITPALRAKLDVVLGAWAAPGMNNPEDPESPHGAVDRGDLDEAVLIAARDRDTRTTAQRNHDALAAMVDFVLGHGALGRPDRLPAELVVTVTDQELAADAGVALTATGAHIPVKELVELAAHAVPRLAVFKNATSEVLYLGRGRRFASKAQRLAMFVRDRGCTAPGCNVPFSRTEAHHVVRWENGGRTDLVNLGAACGRHNRAEGVGPGKWETAIVAGRGVNVGRVGWRPSGSARGWQVNPIHHIGQCPGLLPHGPPRGASSAVETLLSRLLSAA
ncbi:HNH endonuclease [Gordonia sp. HY285]|uniref:HNH endonuclease signature motif containing protein n=1 Tax=Gordonia liuliyuniae TaxID=2911517 RepID=UPI001F21C0F3|nr:HNH endonuclease signature motif containing protein [Gordonia liuliyuniae]MCF8609297.1 HNH endonuclease [Gordonia liuliyuniae]